MTRFDHVVIAVPDLDAAVEAYRGLGFDVGFGGRHTGRGTHNAIIRFGLDYIELLGIYDAAAERDHGGGDLSAFLDRTGGGLIGFALATTEIDTIAARWRSDFAPVAQPEPMERVRPDGFRLQWRLLIPGGTPWGQAWPFIIQWDTPDAERLSHDAPGHHANSAAHVAGVTVSTTSVHRLSPLYADDLGLGAGSELPTGTAFGLGPLQIRLVEGDHDGLDSVELAVTDLNKAAYATDAKPQGEGRLLVPPERARGARITLVGA